MYCCKILLLPYVQRPLEIALPYVTRPRICLCWCMYYQIPFCLSEGSRRTLKLREQNHSSAEREREWSVLAGECIGGTALSFPADSLLSACLFGSRSKRIWFERTFSKTEGINSSELQPLGICLVCQLKAVKLTVPLVTTKFQSFADIKGRKEWKITFSFTTLAPQDVVVETSHLSTTRLADVAGYCITTGWLCFLLKHEDMVALANLLCSYSKEQIRISHWPDTQLPKSDEQLKIMLKCFLPKVIKERSRSM